MGSVCQVQTWAASKTDSVSNSNNSRSYHLLSTCSGPGVWVNFQDHPLDKGRPAGNPVTTPLKLRGSKGRAGQGRVPPGGFIGNCI